MECGGALAKTPGSSRPAEPKGLPQAPQKSSRCGLQWGVSQKAKWSVGREGTSAVISPSSGSCICFINRERKSC